MREIPEHVTNSMPNPPSYVIKHPTEVEKIREIPAHMSNSMPNPPPDPIYHGTCRLLVPLGYQNQQNDHVVIILTRISVDKQTQDFVLVQCIEPP